MINIYKLDAFDGFLENIVMNKYEVYSKMF